MKRRSWYWRGWELVLYIPQTHHKWKSLTLYLKISAMVSYCQQFSQICHKFMADNHMHPTQCSHHCYINTVLQCLFPIIIKKDYNSHFHYGDIIMVAIASQITSLTIVYSTVYSDADQIKHQSSAWLAFVWGIHRGPVNSPHKWPVMRKIFPFDDVIMWFQYERLHMCHFFNCT